jgi:hypothetical protein
MSEMGQEWPNANRSLGSRRVCQWMGRNVPKEDVPNPRGELKAACLGVQAHHVASQPFCPDTASAEYTDWVSGSSPHRGKHQQTSRTPFSVDQIPVNQLFKKCRVITRD